MRPRTLDELADLCGAEVEGDGSLQIAGPASLDEAAPGNVSFLAKPQYAAQLLTTRATAVLVGRDLEVERDDLALLRCENPELAFTEVILAFAPDIPPLTPGVHASSVVDPAASLAANVTIGPHVTVGPHAEISEGVVLHPGARVGPHSKIGAQTVIHSNVVLYPYTRVGERCIVHAGTVLGADGLGFRFEGGVWVKTPQVGNVVIEDDVEIGANTAIDCARFGSTRVGRGTKLDNLVHLAHNVQVGRSSLILAQVGIAGSTTVGDGVIIAGQVGVAGHIHVGDGARIAAQSGLTKDVAPGSEMFGTPAGLRRDKLRKIAGAEKAPREISRLRAELQELRELLRDAIGEGEVPSTGAPGGRISDTGGEETKQRG